LLIDISKGFGMNKFLREMEARSARTAMIHEAMRAYEKLCREKDGSPYARMSGVIESMLTSLAADRVDSTEDVVRQLKLLTKEVA
jgi:hypothetical protein